MTRTPTALLAAAALALPAAAQAQASDLTFYGTLLEFGDVVRTSGATAAGSAAGASQVPTFSGANLPSRARVTSGTSNLGFKGQLEVAPGVRAVFQVESAVSPDGDAPNAWASRNSHVGLATPWGTVSYGLWDTPYKLPVLFVGPVRGLNPFDNAITANPGFGVPATTTQTGRAGAKADAAFNRRQGNSVMYWSPVVEGVSARLAYSVAEGRTTASATAPSIAPSLFSGLVSWDRGPFGVRYAYERHADFFGLAQLGGAAPSLTNTGSTDEGHELVAFYAFPSGTKVSAIVERLSYRSDDATAGNVRRYARNALYLLAQQRRGDHQLWLSYGAADKGTCALTGGAACSTAGLGAAQYAAGYSYALSKSVDLYAAWYRMQNDRSAGYATFPPVGTVAPGADTTGVGLGVLYTFSAGFVKPAPPPSPVPVAPPAEAPTAAPKP